MDKKIKKLKINTYVIRTMVFAIVLFLVFFIGLLFPLRPTFSESEKRELAKFPKFTFETLFNGSFFNDVGTWYSDTYPGREGLIGLNAGVKSLYGFSGQGQVHGEVVEGDEIPEEYSEQNNADEPTTRKPLIVEDLNTQTLGAVFVAGNVGYEYYNFVQDYADHYIGAMNDIGNKLSPNVKVYNMIIPTSIGIVLPDNYRDTINSDDQEKAINYMMSGMNSNVIKIPVLDTLLDHRTEYVYFRTDHHWTALGAYYTYDKFCEVSGIPARQLSQYKQIEFDGFLGTFYNDTGKSPALGKTPDKVIAYVPNENATMEFTDKKGNKIKWPIIYDVSDYGPSLKYATFIAGDNPFTEITNPDITDGSSIIVVKESFGNAFVPFLVDNFSKVYVIDYRYYNGSISDFAIKNNVQHVLYLNNISATRNKWLVSRIEQTI